jgi:hypothetical protein
MSDNNNSNPPPSDDGDWRSNVLQSYRNTEVREIAKVLAAIEGSSTTPSSKLMLAMRFEDSIFKNADSLVDYKKKIAKRLKKLQKNYKPPTALETSNTNKTEEERQRQELWIKLKEEYGSKLLYIIQHSDAAIKDIESKLGSEKVTQFKPHLDSCLQWAKDLGIYKEEEKKIEPKNNKNQNDDQSTKETAEKKEEGSKESDDETTENNKDRPTGAAIRDTSSATTPSSAVSSSLSSLQRLEQHLEKRVDNIRQYVTKHADPNLFVFETMQKKDSELSNKANKFLAANVSRRLAQFQKHQQAQPTTTSSQGGGGGGSGSGDNSSTAAATTTTTTSTPLLALQQALDKAQASVPPPTRNDSKRLEASLKHLDKIRAASTALQNYWTIPEDRPTQAPRQTLQKVHNVVQESMDYVINTIKQQEEEEESEKKKKAATQNKRRRNDDDDDDDEEDKDDVSSTMVPIKLQDAWTKRLELPRPALAGTSPPQADDGGPSKRQRGWYKPYYKARLLFHPHRKSPPQLLSAVRRKGVRLIQPPKNPNATTTRTVNTTYLELDFGTSFTMTVYLSPLIATIRALPATTATKDGETTTVASSSMTFDVQSLYTESLTSPTVAYKPLSYGLVTTTTTTSSSSSTTFTTNDENNNASLLSVWGVSGSYDSIGHVVEERLRDASTYATHVLRRCFRNHVKDKTTDFEVEILEGSALLEFLNIARETYSPGWQDYDF